MTDSESDPQATDIQPLDDRTVQRIAAGEVVERPASVVKELIENSLDAGASRISVTVEGGGTGFLQVSDDGHGIPETELPLAVEEHATSKISDIDDLAGVASLGFRGEALSTIGAVSRLTIRSRPPEASSGAELTVEGGEVGETDPAGCPEGTTVEVEDLFFNTPAREKFLKQDRTEFDHINTVVSQYALANPDVAITLEHDGRELFATEGAGSLRSAVLSVYGREVAESMIDIEYEPDDGEPLAEISGLVSDPETTRSTREYLATFVNSRYVTAATLRNAVIAGYGGQLAPDRYPFAVLFVEVPPDSVDVNVHPRKTEVRFDDEGAVETAVQQAVEDALIDSGLIRSSAPRGRSAPEETTIQPAHAAADAGDDESEAVSTESPPAEASTTQDQPPSSASASGQQSVDESESAAEEEPSVEEESAAEDEPSGDSETTAAADPVDPAAEDSWVVDDIEGESSPTTGTETPSSDAVPSGLESGSTADSASAEAGDSTSQRERSAATETAEASTTESEPSATDPDASDSHESSVDTDEQRAAASTTPTNPTAPTTQRTLDGEPTTGSRQYESLPDLRVLGQLYDTYLLAEADDGLLLIDQHAADERVNYERLQRALGESPTTQQLAEPVRLELTAREAALFERATDELREIGFAAEQRDGREIAVTAVPAVFETTLDPTLLRDALLGFIESAEDADTVAAAVDDLLADLACYPSVTGNTSLTEGSVVDLLETLDDCENPYACPHGRPVVIEISREEIGERFERDYPGHSGRREE